ncbi:hypothetical protein EVAR_63928_1 [Eumeta japonica]|uniref:Uncharacterized protein n=1 Tax=Eumeta variegata TaxID=151549 RepID=A0A4C1ZJT0_EUMVA|nr:hypothetical protein EVAR_63928_1 [Eumeta japonica]
MRNEINDFRIEFSSHLRAAMCTGNERIGTIEKRREAMEKQVSESTNSISTRVPEEAINDFQCQLQGRDQDLLTNDVQVSNVPEMSGENATYLEILIGVKFESKLDINRQLLGMTCE